MKKARIKQCSFFWGKQSSKRVQAKVNTTKKKFLEQNPKDFGEPFFR